MFANVYMYECALEEVKKEVAIRNLVHVIVLGSVEHSTLCVCLSSVCFESVLTRLNKATLQPIVNIWGFQIDYYRLPLMCDVILAK